MFDYEKMGVFYLGKNYAMDKKTLVEDQPVLYSSKDLTTHGVCIGMTGSGKTGLSISLLEEAAIDKIPVIAIDPKGDLGNLLLQFPKLEAADFESWVDPEEASRLQMSTADLAKKKSSEWRNGIEKWQQSGDRIAKLKEAADVNIWTPGGGEGLPLALLKSLAPPVDGNFEEKISSVVASLLNFVGVDCETEQEPEFLLLSQILLTQWSEGKTLQILDLIRLVKKPPLPV